MQQLVPAVQQGNIPAVMQVIERLNIAAGGSKGKDLVGKPGVGKKIRLDTDTTASHDLTQAHSHQVLLECTTNNNNVLHLCCSMVTGKTDVTGDDKSDFSSVESLL